MLGQQPTLRRSKQLYHLELGGGHCELSCSAPGLETYIDYYWLLCIEDESIDLDVIPDAAVDLVLCPNDAQFAVIYSPAEEKYSIPLEGPIHYTGVCFRSDVVWKILGRDIHTLDKLNFGVETIDALNIAGLVNEIQGNHSIASLTTLFDAFWSSRLESGKPHAIEDAKINHQTLITSLEESLGEDNIATVCSTLGISERQLRRVSRDLFGLSPKKLQKILRLQAALDELFRCDQNQMRDLYYDDSHRIRELKRLTGSTPSEIRRMAEKYNSR